MFFFYSLAKIKKKEKIFTIFLQQILSGKLLLVVIIRVKK